MRAWILLAALAACAPAPPPAIVAVPSQVELSSAATCSPGDPCRFACPKGRCEIECLAGSSCSSSCEGGGCAQVCRRDAECDLSCEAGGCRQVCEAGSRCRTSCEAGGCFR